MSARLVGSLRSVRDLVLGTLLGTLLGGGAAHAQSPEVVPSRLDEAIASHAAAAREAAGIPGLSVAVRLPDSRILTAASGLADVENEVPATNASVFRFASISKSLTAVAALRLAARGELDLDADVRLRVPEFGEKVGVVTTRQLLGHLAGVRHYRSGEIASVRHYTDVVTPLQIFANDPLIHPPGTRYLYSTYGFNLAGAVVARAGGESFFALLKREVLDPAGMTATVIDDPFALIRHRAKGYRRVDDRLANSILVDIGNKVPGGGLCGTADDLARFADALLTGRLLDDASREIAWTSQHTSDGKPTGYGCGFQVKLVDGHRIVSHGGAQPQVSTLLWIDADAGLAVVLLANLEGQAGVLGRLAPELAALAAATMREDRR
ncbi:MAG: serine hydrolase domain-containing protein [Planctomycetota bacterium]